MALTGLRMGATIVRVRDVEASVAWWRDQLGVEPLMVGRDGAHPVASLAVASTIVALWQLPAGVERDPDENDRNPYLVFTTDRPPQLVRAELEARGVEVGPLQQSKRFDFFWFHDLDHNRFEITRARETSPVMSTEMTRDEWHAFVLHGTRTAKIGVTRANGAPHVAPIWVVLDGDDVIFTTGAETIKGKSLRRDGRAVFAFDDDNPPFSFVIIEGTAEISEDLDEMLVWATRLGARYMGEEQAEQFGRRNAVKGELLVRVHPTKVIAERGIAD